MKKIFLLFIMTVTTMLCTCNAKSFTIHRGINISHWLSQSDSRGEERIKWFTRDDVKFLAESGFDHLRIPIDEEQMFNEDLTPDSEAFGLLHKALGWCKEFDLRAVVDLHIIRTHHFNAQDKPLFTEKKAQERFYECWRKISAELAKYPRSMVAYELMNEPVADDPEVWNTIVNHCLAVVRELEPKRTIIIGSNRWQSFDTVKQLRVPKDDKNIIISFHFYNPFMFTHYRASWTDMKDIPCTIHYPGNLISDNDLEAMEQSMKNRYGYAAGKNGYNDINTLENQIKQAFDAATQLGKKAYLGEFGAIHGAPEKDRIQWYKDIVSICEKYGIGYANWDYKGGFGIIRNNEKQQQMIDVLTGK